MSRALDPVAKELAVERYISGVSGPLRDIDDSIAEEVVAALHRGRNLDRSRDEDVKMLIHGIAARVIVRSIWREDYLLNLIQQLTALRQLSRSEPVEETTHTLSPAEAAKIIGVSRPYVSMLCDQGKLGTVVKTCGGHRRILASEVDRYVKERDAKYAHAQTPREVGVEIGLYDRDDKEYKNIERDQGK